MGGVMPDAERDRAYKALRTEAERLVRNSVLHGQTGRKIRSDRLGQLWKIFPELRDDACPDAAGVLRILDESDRVRKTMERFT